MKCLICNSETKELYDGCKDYRFGIRPELNFSIEKCSNCGAGYTKPCLSEQELNEFYPSNYLNYQVRRNIAGTYLRQKKRREIKKLLEFKPAGSSLFEIGCGNGETLHLAREFGFEVCGSDLPNEGIVTTKQNFGIDIIPCGVENLTFDKKYDIVVMRHALEHVNNPVSVIHNIYANALNEGGILFLILPRFDSLDHSIMKKFSQILDMPRHRTQFSKKSLLLLLTNAKFIPVRFCSSEAPSFYMHSYLWSIKHQKSAIKKLLYLLAFPIYGVLFPLTFFKPNCMYIIARKS
jgi:2-polyprenyl-3-methyl-5-hydroxy-6-metoxy-1,4-benzoquinol methylase